MQRPKTTGFSALVGVSLLLCVSGCATISAPWQDLFAASDTPPADAEERSTPDVPTYMVELQNGSKEPERYRLPLVDNNTYIQDVLEKSKAAKRFGRVTIQLWRPMPGEAGYQKLDVPFDRAARRVNPGYDYAVHPGDRLEIGRAHV